MPKAWLALLPKNAIDRGSYLHSVIYFSLRNVPLSFSRTASLFLSFTRFTHVQTQHRPPTKSARDDREASRKRHSSKTERESSYFRESRVERTRSRADAIIYTVSYAKSLQRLAKIYIYSYRIARVKVSITRKNPRYKKKDEQKGTGRVVTKRE